MKSPPDPDEQANNAARVNASITVTEHIVAYFFICASFYLFDTAQCIPGFGRGQGNFTIKGN